METYKTPTGKERLNLKTFQLSQPRLTSVLARVGLGACRVGGGGLSEYNKPH